MYHSLTHASWELLAHQFGKPALHLIDTRRQSEREVNRPMLKARELCLDRKRFMSGLLIHHDSEDARHPESHGRYISGNPESPRHGDVCNIFRLPYYERNSSYYCLALQLHFVLSFESIGNHDSGYDEWRRIC